jgi:hypothetical protein
MMKPDLLIFQRDENQEALHPRILFISTQHKRMVRFTRTAKKCNPPPKKASKLYYLKFGKTKKKQRVMIWLRFL